MELKSIKTNKCPVCGCTDIQSEYIDLNSNGIIRQHENGHKYEHRLFVCGNRVDYKPNSCKEEISNTCRNIPSLREIVINRVAAKQALFEFISMLDCDDAFKEIVQYRIDLIDVYNVNHNYRQ